jgi:hypothetical protein
MFVLVGIIAVVTAPFLFMRWLTPKFIFGTAVITGLLLGASGTLIGRLEVTYVLEHEDPNATVSIDGHPVQNPREVLNLLEAIQDLPAHHSHPIKRLRVDVSGRRHTTLALGRDSDNAREYWVFYPRHYITRENEIGRIITPLFDAY